MSEEEDRGHTWDMGLDFDTTRKFLVDRYEQTANSGGDRLAIREGAYIAVMITELVNGSRVSEAMDGVMEWAGSGARTMNVRSRKHGSVVRCLECKKHFSAAKSNRFERITENGELKLVRLASEREKHTAQTGHATFSERFPRWIDRRIVIPQELPDGDRDVIKEAFGTGITLSALEMFAINKLKFNTHSTRYAAITKIGQVASKKYGGQSPQITAKITKHSNVDQIIGYTQQQAADSIQDELANQGKKARRPKPADLQPPPATA